MKHPIEGCTKNAMSLRAWPGVSADWKREAAGRLSGGGEAVAGDDNGLKMSIV